MKRLLILLTVMPSATLAGNTAPVLSEPPVMRPVMATCEQVPVIGELSGSVLYTIHNNHPDCFVRREAGEDNDDQPVADIGQPPEDECGYNGKP